jgi:hypothetical protein
VTKGSISFRWALISVAIAVLAGIAITRVTNAAWAAPVAMGVLMGALIGLGRAMRTNGGGGRA